jgi:hypothetical protein
MVILVTLFRDVLSKLISYFFDPEKTQQDQFTACEILTADIPPMLGMNLP